MAIVAAYAVPHPPLIVPSVGRGEERGIQRTIDAYEQVAHRIAVHAPDTIILSSPHAPAYYDAFAIAPGQHLAGSMVRFRAPQDRMECTLDEVFVREAVRQAHGEGLPLTDRVWGGCPMDHAAFVPLHFVNREYTDYRLVEVGLSGLSAHDHFNLGRILGRVADDLGRSAVYIASGDLSHKLTADGPYGYAEQGPIFDKLITSAFAENRLDALFGFDSDLCEAAAECGLRSFEMMAGALDGRTHTGELLSYEGPFGVGYGIAAFEGRVDDGGLSDVDSKGKDVQVESV